MLFFFLSLIITLILGCLFNKNSSVLSLKMNSSFSKTYIVRQVVRNGFTADGIFGWISIYLAKKIPKTRFLPKSIKINRKNAVLTKFPKLRCPKGRSTALFACQKYLFSNFFVFLQFFGQKMIKKTILSNLKKHCPKTRFFGNF